MKRFILATTAIVTAALLIGTTTDLSARGPGLHFIQQICSQLTEEQREEIHNTVDTMIEEGASPCEIHEAVREMVEGYGIELPERPFGQHGLMGVFGQLTEEQHAEIHEMVDTMNREGASPCEIHEAVREMVEAYGVELPEWSGGRHHHRGWRDR